MRLLPHGSPLHACVPVASTFRAITQRHPTSWAQDGALSMGVGSAKGAKVAGAACSPSASPRLRLEREQRGQAGGLPYRAMACAAGTAADALQRANSVGADSSAARQGKRPQNMQSFIHSSEGDPRRVEGCTYPHSPLLRTAHASATQARASAYACALSARHSCRVHGVGQGSRDKACARPPPAQLTRQRHAVGLVRPASLHCPLSASCVLWPVFPACQCAGVRPHSATPEEAHCAHVHGRGEGHTGASIRWSTRPGGRTR